MIVMINIECETVRDLHAHLSELQRQIKKQYRKRKLTPSDAFVKSDGEVLYDNNCYGTHEVKIRTPKN